MDNGHILDHSRHTNQNNGESLEEGRPNFHAHIHASPLVKHIQVSLLDLNDIGLASPEDLQVASDAVKLKVLWAKFKPDRDWLAPKRCLFGDMKMVPKDFFQ